jgi:hypothetical protein
MEIEPADVTDVRGDVHVGRIAGEPHAGQAVLHDVDVTFTWKPPAN